VSEIARNSKLNHRQIGEFEPREGPRDQPAAEQHDAAHRQARAEAGIQSPLVIEESGGARLCPGVPSGSGMWDSIPVSPASGNMRWRGLTYAGELSNAFVYDEQSWPIIQT